MGVCPVETDVRNATVVARCDLNEELCIVRVRPDSGDVPGFEPGQFAMLGLPRGDSAARTAGFDSERPAGKLVRRAYSIASPPSDHRALEFFVVRIRDGALTPQLWMIPRGGRLWMGDKIQGKFTLDGVSPDQDLVMVSTGTGIAPYMSMLREYHGQGRWRRFVMINGVRKVAELGYRAELEDFARHDPTVFYMPIVSREPADADWPGLRGRVQTVLDERTYERLVGAPLDPGQCHVLLCGNPEMIEETEAFLHDRGFKTHSRRDPGNIHYERYW